MTRSTQIIAVAAGILGLVGIAFAVAMTRDTTPPTLTRAGPGMMGGSGVAPSPPATTPSPGALGDIRNRVDRWLAENGLRGLRVSEVMAFTRTDYVAVGDSHGRPALELLVAPRPGWLMEEPPSMMWNTRYGMMGGNAYGGMMSGNWNGGYDSRGGSIAPGTGPVSSTAQAITAADQWLSQARPGERVDPHVGGMGAFPGYYTLDTTLSGRPTGMVSVNAATGAIWYHTWHGRFLSEQDFQ